MGLWFRLASHLGEPDIDKLMEKVSSTRFVDWNYYLDEVEWKHRSKLDHYLSAIRFDLNVIIHVFRQFCGDKESLPPELEKMFMEFRSGDEPDSPTTTVLKPPPGHGYGMDGVNGDFEKGYGLPGIDTDSDAPLSEEWQRATREQKAIWMGAFAGSIVSYTPGRLDKEQTDEYPDTGPIPTA